MEKTLKLHSLEAFAQQSHYGLSQSDLAALLMHASELRQHFSNLAPFLDLALTKPAMSLWKRLARLGNEGVADTGLSLQDACALCRDLDATRNSLQSLEPVLCPKLYAQLKNGYVRIMDVFSGVVSWISTYVDVHQECAKQSMPGQTVSWTFRIASSPAYFTTQVAEFAKIKAIQFKLRERGSVHIALTDDFKISTVADLLQLTRLKMQSVQGSGDDGSKPAAISIHRLSVDDNTPDNLIVTLY